MPARTPEEVEQRCRELFERHRQTRPHWPQDYALAMSDPIIGRLIELDAKHGITPREGARICAGEPPEVPQGFSSPGASQSVQATLPPPIPKKRLRAPMPRDHGALQQLSPILSGKDLAAGERPLCPECDGAGIMYPPNIINGLPCLACLGTGHARHT